MVSQAPPKCRRRPYIALGRQWLPRPRLVFSTTLSPSPLLSIDNAKRRNSQFLPISCAPPQTVPRSLGSLKVRSFLFHMLTRPQRAILSLLRLTRPSPDHFHHKGAARDDESPRCIHGAARIRDSRATRRQPTPNAPANAHARPSTEGFKEPTRLDTQDLVARLLPLPHRPRRPLHSLRHGSSLPCTHPARSRLVRCPTRETSTLPTDLVVTALGHRAEPSAPWYDPALGHICTLGAHIVDPTAGRIVRSQMRAAGQ